MIGKSKELLFSPYTIITGILFLIFLVNPQLVFLNQNSDINIAPLHFLSIGFALFFFFLIFFLAFYKLLESLVNMKIKRKINFFLVFVFLSGPENILSRSLATLFFSCGNPVSPMRPET